jgi:hypothetical protein
MWGLVIVGLVGWVAYNRIVKKSWYPINRIIKRPDDMNPPK